MSEELGAASEVRGRWWLPAAVIVLIALANVPALEVDLHGDDFPWLESAYPVVARPLAVFDVTSVFFRPLVKLSYLGDYILFGTSSTGYAATNIGIHLVNLALLALLATRLFRNRSTAALTVLLFGVSSYYSEVTLWGGSRPDTILLIFLLAFCIGLELRPGFWRHALLVLALVGAIGSKESWVILPPLTVAWLVLRRGRRIRDALRASWPLLALVALYVVWFIVVPLYWSKRISPIGYGGGDLQAGFTKVCYLVAKYAGLGSVFTGAAWQSALVVAVLAALFLFWLWRRNHVAAWGLVWLLLGVGVAVTIRWAPSRHNYIPLAGFWLMVVAGLDFEWRRLRERGGLPRWVTLAALTACISGSIYYVSYHSIWHQREIRDYRWLGEQHRLLVTAYQRVIADVPEDRPLVLVDEGRRRVVDELRLGFTGHRKLVFGRDDGLWQAVKMGPLHDFCGKPLLRMLVPQPADELGSALAGDLTVVVFDDRDGPLFTLQPELAPALRSYHGRELRLPERVSLWRFVRSQDYRPWLKDLGTPASSSSAPSSSASGL